jgi:hypothetical protein
MIFNLDPKRVLLHEPSRMSPATSAACTIK